MGKTILFFWVGLRAAIDPSCLSLYGSQQCQAFQGYHVDVLNGPLWLQNVTSVQEMDIRLSGYLEQQGQYICGSNTNRYVKTIVCAQMIQNSTVNCNPTLPFLCDDTYQQTCNLQATTTKCIHGYDNDPYCGWTHESDGCTYCQAKPNDTCCTTLNNQCFGPQKPVIIISAALILVFGCLSILGCIWYWRRQRHVHKNDDNDDDLTLYIPSNSTSTLVAQQSTISKDPVEKEETGPTALSYTLAKRHADDYCFYQAIYVNVPCQPYDILLNKGDIVHLHCYTDEDWGIGYNISTGQQGSFPIICIRSLTLDQVWELVESHPDDQQRSLLKHRVYYFISSETDQQGDADDDDDDDDDDTMDPTSNMIHTTPISAIPPSSDDDDSPITPPPPTFIHRALGYNNNNYSHKRWSGSLPHYQPITPGNPL